LGGDGVIGVDSERSQELNRRLNEARARRVLPKLDQWLKERSGIEESERVYVSVDETAALSEGFVTPTSKLRLDRALKMPG
jgi:hypothetical protein